MSIDRLWTLVARKLAGECSAEELTELSSILADNSDLHLQLQSIMTAWQSDNKMNMQEQEASYQKHLNRLKEIGFELHAAEKDHSTYIESTKIRKSANFRKIRFILVATLIAAAITFVSVFLTHKRHKTAAPALAATNNTISTKNGSRTKIELPDGSTAWLNAGSKLTYNKQFGNQLREVQLSGEGFFDVVHDSTKPFIIRTAFIDIKDLGTQFNVKCYPNDKTTEVSLVRGSVEITMKKRPNDKWVLKPNEKISVLNTVLAEPSVVAKKGITVKKPDLPILTLDKVSIDKNGEIEEVAWTKNKLAFVNESMDLMALKLERWFGKPVIIQNSRLNVLQFTATFETESMEQVLKALQLSSGNKINFVIDTDKVIIY